MSDLLDGVLADLAAESERLDALVSPLGEADWRRATPASGWDVATQVAHLAWTDEALLAELGPLEQKVGRETHRVTVELLGVDESRPGVRELVQATLDLVRGLGLANTLGDDARRRRRILKEWSRSLEAALGFRGSQARTSTTEKG